MTHLASRTDGNTIRLSDRVFKVVNGQIDEDIVNIHQRKVNQGDPGPDDHPIWSTFVQSDWTGGGQVTDGSPDVVTGRFEFANAETMPAKTITLPALPDDWDDPTLAGRDSFIVGTYDGTVWAAWGSDLQWYDFVSEGWIDIAADLTAAPRNKGVVFVPNDGGSAGTDFFCIPCGSAIDVINGTTRTTIAKSAVDLVVHDHKLWRLGTDGSVEFTTDLSTWSSPTIYIPGGETPRHLIIYLTVGGEPEIYVTTSSQVYILDNLANTFIPTQLKFPRHPDQGRGSAVWRGELYTSVGDGVHRYNRSTIAAQGLDRDDGLIRVYSGVITDLEPSYNCLFAMLSGSLVWPAEEDDPYYMHAGDDYMVSGQPTGSALLMKWNGFGWHYVDSVDGESGHNVHVSDANDEHAAWYAIGSKVYRIKYARTYMNLKYDITTPVRTEGWFETSWYDYGWKGQHKVLKSLDIFIDTPSTDEYVEVFYKTDKDENPWVKLGEANETGEHPYYFGIDSNQSPGSTNPNHYSGVSCDKVKLRFVLHRGESSTTTNKPIIRWFTLVARKILRPVRTFRLVLNLVTTRDYTADQQREFLLDLLRNEIAVEFVYQNEKLKVDVVALNFRSQVPQTRVEYLVRLNLIESFETIN